MLHIMPVDRGSGYFIRTQYDRRFVEARPESEFLTTRQLMTEAPNLSAAVQSLQRIRNTPCCRFVQTTWIKPWTRSIRCSDQSAVRRHRQENSVNIIRVIERFKWSLALRFENADRIPENQRQLRFQDVPLECAISL
jgi:hypothetical protein